jgi:hypothetical protein
MGLRMLWVLIQELSAHNVASHIANLPPQTWGNVPWFPAGSEAISDRGEESDAWIMNAGSWLVVRNVQRHLRNGTPYLDIEFRRRDGTWVFDRREAERFDEPPDELLRVLRQASADESEPRSMLLPPGPTMCGLCRLRSSCLGRRTFGDE